MSLSNGWRENALALKKHFEKGKGKCIHTHLLALTS